MTNKIEDLIKEAYNLFTGCDKNFSKLEKHDSLSYADFNQMLVSEISKYSGHILLDIGGGNGFKIANRVPKNGKIYIIDPEGESSSGVNVVRQRFDKNLGFLNQYERNNIPKIMVNLRTPAPEIAYQTLDSALKYNGVYVAVEPLFWDLRNCGFPRNEKIKNHFSGQMEHVNLILNSMPFRVNDYQQMMKQLIVKELIVLDLASAFLENGYDAKVYSIAEKSHANPPDSEHFMIARKR